MNSTFVTGDVEPGPFGFLESLYQVVYTSLSSMFTGFSFMSDFALSKIGLVVGIYIMLRVK